MDFTTPNKKIVLVIIILTSLFLRVYNLNYMEFKGDEAFSSFKALDFVDNGNFPLASSIGTTGIHEPPIFIYFLSIPYLFSRNPVIATGFIALLNVLGIYLFYRFIKKTFNEETAVFASIFYAINPWQIVFSRKIWAQNLLALLIIVFLFFLFNSIYKNKKSHIAYALLFLGILLQLHLSAVYFGLIALIMVIMHYKKIDKKYLLLGIALLFLTLLPYAIFQIKNDFVDARVFLGTLKENFFHPEAFTIPLKMVSTQGFNSLLGESFPPFIVGFENAFILDYMAILLFLASFVYLAATKHKFFVFWLVIGASYLSLSKVPSIDTHYFTSLLPALFVVLGSGVYFLIKKSSGNKKYFVYAFLFMLIIYQFAFSFHLISFISKKECIGGDYGMPYQYRLNLIENMIDRHNITNPTEQIEEINKKSCGCTKCDQLAARFIIENMIDNPTAAVEE